MDPDRWARLRGLIEEALDVPDGERDEYLRSACGDDADLLKEAAEFLRFDAGDAGPSSVSRGERRPEAWDAFLSRIGERGSVGDRYEPLGEIGRGGMGVVRKVLDKDLRRTLAMKVVRSDAASGSRGSLDSVSLGRFLEEAQVTSQLDHPGIVPVHELGVDGDGNVYFTMKLVKGIELKRVFERVADGTDGWTSTRALNVILRACEAVAYAHAKGVIHRDLKPSNIMVGRYGETYVMDWGLARVLGGTEDEPRPRPEVAASVSVVASDRAERKGVETDSSLGTMDGDIVGTPVYMPPEQAGGQAGDVGPRSDVYAMGAILYQLLTGRMPYVPPETSPSPHLVLRWVLEGPPTPVAELNAAVPPELVAICEKAMSRDPSRRYATMGELAEDLRAYVERRVVKAYATGPTAELRKWVARNRGAALGIAAGVLAVVAAGFFTAWQQRQNAELVARERDAARAVAEFQRDVLTIDPWEIGPEATPLDVVDRAAQRAHVAFEGRGELGATVLLAVGDTYSKFGAYRQAAEQYEASLAARLEAFSETDPPVIEARSKLAQASLSLGRLKEAADLHREIFAARRDRLGEGHPETVASKLDLAEALRRLLRYDEASALLREVVETRTRTLGERHVDTLEARRSLARALLALDRDEEADRIYAEILAVDSIPEKLVLECRSGRASALTSVKKYEEAAAIEREVFESYRTRLGDLHPDTLRSRDRLAGLLFALRRYEEVLEMDRQVLARRRSVLGETHPDTFMSMVHEAYDLVCLGRTEEAIRQGRAAADGCRATHGTAHPTT
ncbi:MAG: tetratricopeptide repeat protein, partial [Planctomycetota bacterium JB042]